MTVFETLPGWPEAQELSAAFYVWLIVLGPIFSAIVIALIALGPTFLRGRHGSTELEPSSD